MYYTIYYIVKISIMIYFYILAHPYNRSMQTKMHNHKCQRQRSGCGDSINQPLYIIFKDMVFRLSGNTEFCLGIVYITSVA